MKIIEQISFYLILSGIVLFSFYYKLAHIPFILAFPIVVYLKIKKNKNSNSKLNFSSLFLLGVLLLLLIVKIIGLNYSINLLRGLHQIELLLSLIYISLTIFIYPFSQNQLNLVKKTFILSVFSGCLFLFIYSFRETDEYVTISKYTYVNLAAFNHPSYYSLLVNSALFLVLYQNWKSLSVKLLFLNIFLAFYFITFTFLLASKAGYLVMFFTIFFGFTWFFQKQFISIFQSLILVLLALSVFIGVFILTPLSKRVKEGVENTIQDSGEKYSKEMGSTETRKYIWQKTWAEIKKNPIKGYGTGSFEDIIFKEKIEGMTFNAHNQFLEIWFENGVFGFLLLTSWFLFIPLTFLKKYWYLALFLGINIFINFGVETMLSRLAGVLFISILTGFILHYNNNKAIYNE